MNKSEDFVSEIYRIEFEHCRQVRKLELQHRRRVLMITLASIIGAIASVAPAFGQKTELEIPITFDAETRATIRNQAGDVVSITFQPGESPQVTLDELGPPPTSVWPEKAFTPAEFEHVIEVDEDLELSLGVAHPGSLVIVTGSAVAELRELAEGGDVSKINGFVFTAKPGEWFEHDMAVAITTEDPVKIGFQGFRMDPGGDGYGARHTHRGKVSYRYCPFSGGTKGIAVTGETADVDLEVIRCTFDNHLDGVSAGIYSVRGKVTARDCHFNQIGYPAGGERPDDAILDHGIYLQWECEGDIQGCWFRHIASHAVQLRGGGTIRDCIAIDTANGFSVGHAEEDRPHVVGKISRVVVSDTTDVRATLDPKKKRNTGVCFWIERARVDIERSVCANNRSRGEGAAVKPLDHADVELRGLASIDIPRVIDVGGTNVKLTGTIAADGYSRVIGWRPGSEGQVEPDVTDIVFEFPDLREWPEPEPGEVEDLVAKILGG